MGKTIICCFWAIALSAGKTGLDAPATMPLPENYREWIWLTSGLGMSYTPGSEEREHPSFDNVFVNREAYQAFKKTGLWPDKTTLVLEIRHSESRGSINQSGHFQSGRTDVETHVKDDRFPGKWAFYAYGNGEKTGKLIPKSANCYSCHEQHALVDTTFVQFYPTLLEIAKAKGSAAH